MPVSELDAPENSLTLTAEELAFAQATPVKTLTDAVATPEWHTSIALRRRRKPRSDRGRSCKRRHSRNGCRGSWPIQIEGPRCIRPKSH